MKIIKTLEPVDISGRLLPLYRGVDDSGVEWEYQIIDGVVSNCKRPDITQIGSIAVFEDRLDEHGTLHMSLRYRGVDTQNRVWEYTTNTLHRNGVCIGYTFSDYTPEQFNVGDKVYAIQNITYYDLFNEPDFSIYATIGTSGIVEDIDYKNRLIVSLDDQTAFDMRGLVSKYPPRDTDAALKQSALANAVEINSNDSIYIFDDNGGEIVMWEQSEFNDPDAIFAALNAIKIRCIFGADMLKKVLGQ